MLSMRTPGVCRRKRKEARRTHYAASMYSEQSKAHPQDKDGQTSPAVEPREQAPAAQAGNDQASFSGGSTASEDLDSMNGGAHEDESSDGESNHEGFTSEAGGDEQALVSIVTADFAMQNLILQLGLKLVSPDGRQIKRISRWALRCSACFKVTKVSYKEGNALAECLHADCLLQFGNPEQSKPCGLHPCCFSVHWVKA